MRIFFFFIFLLSFGLQADDSELSLDELLDQEKYEAAVGRLKEKISFEEPTMEDILLLGKLYEGLSLEKKAIKTYLYGIRKFHSSSWKEIKSFRHLREVLPDLKEPSQNALLLGFKVGVLYYDLYLVSNASEAFNRRILETSLKYLLICERFNFNLPKTRYFLGLIFKEYGDYKKSAQNLLASWKDYEKKKLPVEDEQKLKLMYGESTVNYGYFNLGTALLRSAYYQDKGSRYLKDYAAEYLDEFKGSSVGGAISFKVGNDSNVLIGNSTGSENIKNSRYTEKTASIFLGHSPSYSSTYNFSLGFTEELLMEDVLKDNDARTLSFTSNWDYKKFDRQVLSLSYFFSKSYARPRVDEEFEPESESHQITLGWQKIFKSSILGISTPFNRTFFESGVHTDSLGLGFSLELLTFSKYWNPIFRLDYSKVEEGDGFEDSKSYILNFTNGFNLSTRLGGNFIFNYEKNSNENELLAYSERELSLNFYYYFKNIDGLSLDIGFTSESNSTDSGNSDTRLKTGLGLGYIL